MVRILQEGQHLGVDRPKSQDMFCYSGCSSSCREEERGLVDIVCVGEGGVSSQRDQHNVHGSQRIKTSRELNYRR